MEKVYECNHFTLVITYSLESDTEEAEFSIHRDKKATSEAMKKAHTVIFYGPENLIKSCPTELQSVLPACRRVDTKAHTWCALAIGENVCGVV